MLNIKKNTNGTSLWVTLEGRLDSNTSPEMERSVKESIEGMTEIVLNFDKLTYVSSAGLRVLLTLQQATAGKSSMYIVNCNDDIKDIFEMTGFLDILELR